MAKKDNFGSAMFDMFGVGKGGEKEPAKETPEKRVEFTAPEVKAPEHKSEPAPAPAAKTVAPAAKPVYAKSVIGVGTTFEGNVTTHGDLEISGELKGNVYSEGKVVVMSNTTGNIKAATVSIFGCQVNGDIVTTGLLEIDATSSVNGNIIAGNIICAGTVTGDLDIKENFALSDSGVINGNIKMASMSVAKGAKITGKLEMQN